MQLDSVPPAPARPVAVEVYLLRAEATGRLAYRRRSGPLHADEDPDGAARRLAGLPGEGPTPLVHSTSWRCAPDGQVILTYAVVPDPDPEQPAVPLDDAGLAHGERADRPSPVRVEFGQVAAHAVRHLAFLAQHDPHAGAPLGADPLLAEALARCSPGLAGSLN